MIYRIRFLQTFMDGLEEIGAYLDTRSETASDELRRQLYGVVEQLIITPRMFQRHEEIMTHHELRRFIIGNDTVFYVVDEAQQMVKVVDIFRSSRDVTAILKRHIEQ